MKKKIISAVVGILISVLILSIGLILLELLVRKIKPQITLSQAQLLSPGDFAPSDFAPFTLRPNIRHGAFFTNSLGYRSDEFVPEKPVNTYRVLALGDSFVSSIEPDNNHAWPQVLQSLLSPKENRRVEVINAGFHDGYSPDSYYAYLKAEGLALKPDLVVEGIYFQNDVGDLKPNRWPKIDDQGLPLQVISDYRKVDGQGRQWDGMVPLRYRYPILSQSHLWILFAEWIDRHIPILFHTQDEAVKVKEFNAWNDLTYSDCVYRSYCFPKFQAEFDKLLTVLAGTSQLLKENGIPYLIVFEPSRTQVRTLGYPLPDEDIYRLQNKVTSFFATNNLSAEFLDLTPEMLSGNPWEYYYETDGHWNISGNQLAAEIIAHKIWDMQDK